MEISVTVYGMQVLPSRAANAIPDTLSSSPIPVAFQVMEHLDLKLWIHLPLQSLLALSISLLIDQSGLISKTLILDLEVALASGRQAQS